jgi:indolepyruvate decarboxylase
MSQTVIQYVLSRLKDLGVTETFGCPGDFVYPVCDAVEDDPDINAIWCANELNASYAAEGYARTKGVGVIVSTYGPGEMSTFAGLGGAHAENVKVVSLVGMPGLKEQATNHRTHHMIADQQPNYDLFCQMTKPFTAGGDSAAVITAENCVYETERLIAAMLYHSKPIYMVFPRDQADAPVVMPEGELDIPLANPQSDPDALEAVVKDIVQRVTEAKQACILPGYLLRRYDCVTEAKALVEASGLPFVSSLQDKGVLPETHPQFAGIYLGGWVELADPVVNKFVEGCDCIIGLGPENHEFNNAFHTMEYDFKATMNIMPHKTRVGMSTYDNVEMKDVLSALVKEIPNRSDLSGPSYSDTSLKFGAPSGEAKDAIDYEPLFERYQTFMKPNDILVSDTSFTAICASMRLQLPDGVNLESGASWGSIGWGTPEILGNCAAARDRRCILMAGEGGHQMTANEMGTFYRYGLKPIFFLVNNDGYFAERATNRDPDESYNDLAQWNFADIPAAMGCKDWYTARVTTLGELDAALAEAEKATSGVYIEIVIDRWLAPKGTDFMFAATGAMFGKPGRTWDGWLKEMAAKNK